MSFELIIVAIVLLANFFLGLIVYVRNPLSWTNRFFVMITFVIGVYAIIDYLSLHPPIDTAASQLFWIRATMAVGAFIGPALFLLVHTFPRNSFSLPKKYLVLVIGSALLTSFLSFTPLIFKAIEYPNGVPLPVPGAGIALYFLDFIGFILLSFGLLIMKYRRSSGVERVRYYFFLLGVVATFTLMFVTTLVSVVILKTSSAVFLGPVSSTILGLFVAYSIVRHQFLDIKPAIMRLISFTVLLGLLASFYAVIFLIGFNKVLGIPVPFPVAVVMYTLSVLAMLSFQPLLQALKKKTDKMFFKADYNSDELLGSLTRIMAEKIDLDDLVKSLMEKILKDMRLSKGAFLFVDKKTVTGMKGVGYENDKKMLSPELLKLFDNGNAEAVLFDSMAEGKLKQLFRSLDILIAIPIRVEGKPLAVLVFGSKLSSEVYFDRDVKVLALFASEAGIAIQNAQAYSQIKQFSAELEKKVEERTKQLKGSQKQELEKAQEVTKLKDEFVFLAVHELKTPVTAIRGFLELTKDAEKNFPKDVQENLSSISQASDHLNQLVNDILEIARNENNAKEEVYQPADFRPIVDSVLGEVSSLMTEKKIALTVDDKLDSKVICDQKKVKEVLVNLIGNAIKYNREGGEIYISLYKLPRRKEMMFEIRDTGYGIPKDQQDKIFQKFFRAMSKDTQDVLGTGLGLFITRMLVEKMGGKLQFSSVEHEGTTFSLTLPLEKE